MGLTVNQKGVIGLVKVMTVLVTQGYDFPGRKNKLARDYIGPSRMYELGE